MVGRRCSEYPGWFAYYVPFPVFVKMAVMGIWAYTVIAAVLMRNVNKIPLDEALKITE